MNSNKPNRHPPGLAARAEALRLLSQVFDHQQNLSDALLDSPSSLPPPDRALARAIATISLRHYGQINHWLTPFLKKPLPKKSGTTKLILITATAQLLLMRIPAHAAIDQAVRLTRNDPRAKHFSGLVNGVLRQLTRTPPAELSAEEALKLNTPDWLWQRWQKQYGADLALAICHAQLQEPPLDITLKNKAEATDWAEKLDATILAPGSLRLAPGHGPITELAGFKEGAWWVQDVAATLPAKLLDDVTGKSVLDLCAAPGGKTAQLAAAGAMVTTVDISANRNKRLAENLARLQLKADIITCDALTYKTTGYDTILLDAPCSATGTIRRHPDALYLKSGKQITELAKLQQDMLRHAASLLKPDGVLIYCTCSLEFEEGEQQIESFLAADENFQRLPITASETSDIATISPQGDMRSLPSQLDGGMDGFFIARLKRTG